MLPFICDRCGKSFEERPGRPLSRFGLSCSPECQMLITLARCPSEKVKQVYLSTLDSDKLAAMLKSDGVETSERQLIDEAFKNAMVRKAGG